MFEALNGLYTILSLLLVLLWGVASLPVSRLVPRPSRKYTRITAWVSLLLLLLAELLVLAKIIVVWQMWSQFGWYFAQTAVVAALPFLVPPAVYVLVVTMPRLWNIAVSRGATENRTPYLAIPVQATAIASGIGFYLVLFPFTTSVWTPALILAGLFAGSIAALLAWSRVPRSKNRAFRSVVILVILAIGCSTLFVRSMQASRLPDRLPMMGHEMDFGGGSRFEHAGHENHGSGHSQGTPKAIPVTELTGPRTGEPDRQFTLTARKAKHQLTSGATVETWTFDGQIPGPELRVRQGDLVEVTLVNQDIEDGVTIHWHGLNVPNAEDGVAGVTQDAVLPGESYTYRFVAEQVGSFWYHSHQQSAKQVRKGLFGALIIEPREPQPKGQLDIPVVFHDWETTEGRKVTSIGMADTVQRRIIAPGTPVRLRLINADSYTKSLALTGTPFKLTAIDGNDINEPTDLIDKRMVVGGGGRFDVAFVMPNKPVTLHFKGDAGRDMGMVFSPDGSGEMTSVENIPEVNLESYGSPAATPFGPDSKFDRSFTMFLDSQPGFYNGKFTYLWTINGEVFPHTPMQMVKEGELIKMTFVNRSWMDHPIHPHGHHMLVLSRNGREIKGSPWWTDTLNVAPGEVYEVAIKADNPGIWMDHCHNLDHAATGMTLHLGYEGVTTPFEVGRATRNQPE